MSKTYYQIRTHLLDPNLISEKFKYTLILRSVTITHFLIAFIALSLKVYPLFLFNLVSIATYFTLEKAIQKELYKVAFNIICLEIFAHTYLCNFLIGWEFGFSLYVLALIPVSFYISNSLKSFKEKFVYPFIYTVISFVVFISCKIFLVYREPLYHVATIRQRNLVYAFNTLVAYLMLLIFSLLFVLEIRASHIKVEMQNEELAHLASTDSLTGLLNRRKMLELVQEYEGTQNDFSLVLCDIDNFKKLNDNYGHDCGDKVLLNISKFLRSHISTPNQVCRWGGEEILILLTGSHEDSVAFTKQLCAGIAATSTNYDGHNLSVTMTFGVSSYQKGTSTIDRMIIDADQKMYYGKANGKNQVVA